MRIYIFLIGLLISGSSIIGKNLPIDLKPQVSSEIKAINDLVDRWHKAAADTDFEAFFDCMDEGAYYIGTDESEKWNMKEFKAFCKPYFDKGSAWDFKPFDRGVYLNEAKDLAWFDEKLNTWMGVCRSSGVIIKVGEKWKIKHYHLSIAVPNELTRDFIQLVEKYKAEQPK